MRLSKHGRSKKGHVAPMSDDDDNGNDNEDLRLTNRQTNAFQLRQASRGVSFTTSRGRIWLILVINLVIVTAFIFMSSSRFPSLSGEGVVNEALEQDHQHPGPVNKNVDQVSTLSASDLTMTKAPKTQENTRSGGYTMLTSTDHPEAPEEDLDLTDGTESETEITDVPSVETPAEQIGDEEKILNPEPVVVSETQEAHSPASGAPSVPSQTLYFAASDIDQDTSEAFTKADISSVLASTGSQRSPADVTEQPSQIEESQPPSSDILLSPLPSPQQSIEAELSSTASTATVQAVEALLEVQPASNALLDNLSMWLAADSGVEVENLAACLASSGDDVTACGVISWTSQIVNSDNYAADAIAFHAASPQQRTVWVPIAPDTHSQLPAVYFSCPMVTETGRVHESMTLLFVISPAQIVEQGDLYTGQKFFGNSPYGQFALHGGKPSFFANNGLVESDHVLPVGRFSLLTYRLHSGYAEIKVNGGPWGGESPVEGDTDERHVRITVNEVVSLGNSKSACDTNAFQGRIAEVLVYDAVLDNAQVEAVEKYLYDKWWGNKPFPETVAATSEPGPATEAPHDEIADVLPALNPDLSDPEPASKAPHAEDANDSPTTDPIDPTAIETVSGGPENEPSATGKALQTSSTARLPDGGLTTAAAAETEAAPASKFDPRINIFEWTPPSEGGTSPAKEQWARTVKERVDLIHNFQLGGDVLRALIRQHRDELVALRDELFG
ncbi:hypothetical protein PRNP1_002901 [Phytophthora ramorum]